MNFPPSKQNNIQDILNKIQNDKFDRNDISNLLISLRPYYYGNIKFREIADFVAHYERNKGITSENLEALFLNMKYVVYLYENNDSIILDKPIPLFVKELMISQIEKRNDIDFKKYNYTKAKLKNHINSFFKDNSLKTFTCYTKPNWDPNFHNAVNYLLEFIDIHPVFKQQEVFNELLDVILKNNFKIKIDLFRKREGKIVLAILILLHDTVYKTKYDDNFKCKISLENSNSLDKSLILSSLIPMKTEGKFFSISHPIFLTNLNAKDWCKKSAFTIDKKDLIAELKINRNFKLVSTKKPLLFQVLKIFDFLKKKNIRPLSKWIN